MKVQKINKWFTLIELLVVITIIGILATGATTVYTSQIQKARDTTRLNDAKALVSAVEMIYQDKAEYPAKDEWFVGKISLYIQQFPKDPKHGQTCNQTGKPAALTWDVACAYAYNVWDDINDIDNWAYEISTALENSWNIKAKGQWDGWEDDSRYEVWLLKSWNGKADLTTYVETGDVAKANKWICIADWTLVVSGNFDSGYTVPKEDSTTALSACGTSS